MSSELLRIKAEMARRGLLGHQLTPYENPDTERTVYPRQEPETLGEVWEFLLWLERTVDA
jgi:hypothetical protein